MVAMCLVKDPTKRPTAEKLLKHSFFKHSKPPELSVKKLFADLPPLWNRVKALQLKDAAQLALKKMPSAEQEALSQSEYKRGVSAWNFDIGDLKEQASLVQDEDDITEMKGEDERMKSYVNDKDASSSRSSLMKSVSTADIIGRGGVNGDEIPPIECLNEKASEKDVIATKGKAVKSRQSQSGPLMPGIVLGHSHSLSERSRTSERCDNEQIAYDKAKREVRKAPSFSGPLMLPNRASGNSLSAPIKPSSGFRDSLEDKSKANLVQIKGRFSVTSENVDLVKDIPLCTVTRRSCQGSPLKKSASVGDWTFDKQMPVSVSPTELSSNNVPTSLLMPQLQNLFQQTSVQQDLIMNLLNTLQPTEAVEASQNGKLPPVPRNSESNGSVDIAALERERLLLIRISELQARMMNLTDELSTEKLKYIQLQKQLNAVSGLEEGDERERDA